MLTFKEYITEVLSPNQEADVATWPKRTTKATRATDQYFGRGNEDKHEELAGTQDKSEIHQKIEKHLGVEIKPEEYKEGKMKDKFGRQVRIGAVLGKTKAPTELARGFENDSTRQGKGYTGLSVRTTRSASGVAGQTSGNQSWEDESCKNIEGGCNRHYLPAEVRHGTVVSYLHDHQGKELARATFQPYHNPQGATMYKQDSYYGVKHAGFMEHNKKTEEALTGAHKKGSVMYEMHPKVYNNSGNWRIMHPKATSEDIDKEIAESGRSLSNLARSTDVPEIHQKILAHPEVTTSVLHDVAHSTTNPEVHKAVVNHPKAIAGTLEMMARTTGNPEVHNEILKHPLNNQTIMTSMASKSNNPEIQKALVNHPLADENILSKVGAYTNNPEVHKEILKHPMVANFANVGSDPSSILNNIAHNTEDRSVQKELIKHPKLSSDGLRSIAGSTVVPNIHEAILNHPNATKDVYGNTNTGVLSKISQQTESPKIHKMIVNHPDTTPEILSNVAGNSTDEGVHEAIMNHPKVDDYALSNMVRGGSHETRQKILQHPKASRFTLGSLASWSLTPELHKAILNHPEVNTSVVHEVSRSSSDPDVQLSTLNHPAVATPGAQSAVLDELSRHPANHEVSMAIMNHPKVDSSHIDNIARNTENPKTQMALLQHSKILGATPIRAIAARTNDPEVQRAAMNHPQTNISVFNTLANNRKNSEDMRNEIETRRKNYFTKQ